MGRPLRVLKKWFWATSIVSRYTGKGYRQNLLSDITFFERLGKKRNSRFPFRDLVAVTEVRAASYLVLSSLSTAFFLLLSKREPLYLENESRIPIGESASVANRKDKKHIFSKALSSRNNVSAKQANSLCKICYVVAEENQSIGSNKPAFYLTASKENP